MPVGRTLTRKGRRPSPVSFVSLGLVLDADATSYIAAMTVQPDNTRKTLINDLITGLKTDNVWTSLDWFILLAAHDEQAARINAKVPSKIMTTVNSPVYTTDRGFVGDGSSSYLDLGESWQTSPNFTQDSCSLGVWINQGGSTDSRPAIGLVGAGSSLIAINSGTAGYRLNSSSTPSATAPDRLGMRTGVRVNSTTVKGFVGPTLGVTSTTSTSSVPSGANACILRGNTVYSFDRVAAAFSGGTLADTQVAALYTRLNTYLTAIGAN